VAIIQRLQLTNSILHGPQHLPCIFVRSDNLCLQPHSKCSLACSRAQFFVQTCRRILILICAHYTPWLFVDVPVLYSNCTQCKTMCSNVLLNVWTNTAGMSHMTGRLRADWMRVEWHAYRLHLPADTEYSTCSCSSVPTLRTGKNRQTNKHQLKQQVRWLHRPYWISTNNTFEMTANKSTKVKLWCYAHFPFRDHWAHSLRCMAGMIPDLRLHSTATGPYSFPIPSGVGGWVGPSDWLHITMVYPWMVTISVIARHDTE